MSASEVYLDRLIAIQRRAIRYYFFFAAGLVLLGVIVIVATLASALWLSSIPEALKAFFGVGGAFVSSLSAFQVKEILSRKDKVETFTAFKLRMRSADETERQQIEELVWEVTKKIAQG